MIVLFEGARAAVEAQAGALGGDEADPWDELRALQARLPGRRAGTAAPRRSCGPGRASRTSRSAVERPWSPLAERIVEALCNPS